MALPNNEFHFRLEFHKCFVLKQITFCDCACHFRLEKSKFGAIYGLGKPTAGWGGRLGGEETPPVAPFKCGMQDSIHLRYYPQTNTDCQEKSEAFRAPRAARK